MSRSNLLLVGGGGHCRSVIDVIEQENRFGIAGIIDMPDRIGDHVMGYPVIASDQQLPELVSRYSYALVTVGQIKSCKVRLELFKKLQQIGFTLPAIISPLAYVSKHAQIGQGTVVMHGALVNANANVGNNCVVNTKALIEHDAKIHDHCHISTAAVINGGVEVKEGTFVGSNATSVQYTSIDHFIKAGSLAK